MRVAALYDIHANLPALEAVADDIRSTGVDQVVVGGDVLPGPMTPSRSWQVSGAVDRSAAVAGMGRAGIKLAQDPSDER